MKKIILFLLLIMISQIMSQKINIPKYSILELKNGTKVILLEDKKLPLVQIKFFFTGGSRLDPKGLEGLTSITTELITKGTKNYSAQQVAENFEILGSEFNSYTGYDYSVFSTELLKEKFEAGLNIISELLISPSLLESEFTKIKGQKIDRFKSLLEDPRSIIEYAFPKFIYSGHAYSHSVDGDKKSLNSISIKNVQEHFNTNYNTSNLLIILVGDINSSECVNILEKYFSPMRKGDRYSDDKLFNFANKKKKLIVIDNPDLTQTQIRFGNSGVKSFSEDYYGIQIANTMFGGGFTSRLNNEIRVKRSLTYGASSYFQMLKDGGSFNISTFTKNKSTEEVFKVIFDEIKKFREVGPSDAEIQKAKKYILGNFARRLQSIDNLSNQIAQLYFYNYPVDFLDKYVEKINSISKADLMKIINKYFTDENILMMVVTNSDAVKPTIEKYGEETEVIYFEKLLE